MMLAQTELNLQLRGLKAQGVKRLAFTIPEHAASMTTEQKLMGAARLIGAFSTGRVTKLRAVGDAPRPFATV